MTRERRRRNAVELSQFSTQRRPFYLPRGRDEGQIRQLGSVGPVRGRPHRIASSSTPPHPTPPSSRADHPEPASCAQSGGARYLSRAALTSSPCRLSPAPTRRRRSLLSPPPASKHPPRSPRAREGGAGGGPLPAVPPQIAADSFCGLLVDPGPLSSN